MANFFSLCKPEIASGFLNFLSPRFGTAKVETFLSFPKYIFYILRVFFLISFETFASSFAGCKGINLFVISKIYFLYFLWITSPLLRTFRYLFCGLQRYATIPFTQIICTIKCPTTRKTLQINPKYFRYF